MEIIFFFQITNVFPEHFENRKWKHRTFSFTGDGTRWNDARSQTEIPCEIFTYRKLTNLTLNAAADRTTATTASTTTQQQRKLDIGTQFKLVMVSWRCVMVNAVYTACLPLYFWITPSVVCSSIVSISLFFFFCLSYSFLFLNSF